MSFTYESLTELPLFHSIYLVAHSFIHTQPHRRRGIIQAGLGFGKEAGGSVHEEEELKEEERKMLKCVRLFF